jgi:hypothetical protein
LGIIIKTSEISNVSNKQQIAVVIVFFQCQRLLVASMRGAVE